MSEKMTYEVMSDKTTYEKDDLVSQLEELYQLIKERDELKKLSELNVDSVAKSELDPEPIGPEVGLDAKDVLDLNRGDLVKGIVLTAIGIGITIYFICVKAGLEGWVLFSPFIIVPLFFGIKNILIILNELQINKENRNKYDKDWDEYWDKKRKWYHSRDELTNKLNERKLEAKTQYDEMCERINTYNLISSSYYYNIPDIITILENGRADSIKEAINVLESDKYQQRLVDLEEERTRIARSQQVALERAREQQRQEQHRQEELRQKEERDQRRAGDVQCGHCARCLKCSIQVKMHNNGNCASYYPK